MIDSLRNPPIAFAHRGGQAHAAANTLAAFEGALSLGAPGLETDAWTTADGVVVLDHDGKVRRGLRRRHFRDLARDQLPDSIPSIGELYARCGSDFELSVDLKDPEAIGGLVEAARGARALDRLWLCHPDWEWLRTQAGVVGSAHLVHSTSIRRGGQGPERLAAQLSEAGIAAVNLHRTEWSGGLTTLFHRFGRLAFGWDAQHEREIRELVDLGIDAVYSDHVDRLNAVMGTAGPGS